MKITNEQVKAVRESIGKMSGSWLSNRKIQASLEAAFQDEPQPIKPIAFADRRPENGQAIWVYEPENRAKDRNEFECWYSMTWTNNHWKFKHSWLPFSALPIPVDPQAVKEASYKEFLAQVGWPDGPIAQDVFDQIWVTAQQADIDKEESN